MYKSPETRMTAARTRLLLDFPWFGSLAMRLKVSADESIPTFQTDGTNLKYNPTFLESLTDPELTAVIGHEVMHCALLHPYRRGNRDLKQWNRACDYAINSELTRAGLQLPKDALRDAKYEGLSADVIYAQLGKKDAPDGPQTQGTGTGGNDQGNDQGQEPGNQEPSTGSVGDAPAPGNELGQGPGQAPGNDQQTQMTESDWKIAAEQASDVARGCGKLPGNASELVKQARQEPADWRAILREFVEHTTPSDYSWLSPNRRHISDGLYLPGMTRENLGHVAVAVDTSGSIDQKALAAFCAELNAIVNEAQAEGVTVIYCDSRVQRTEEYGPDEEITLTAVGRGGTRFSPVFEAISLWDSPPVCLIYFTDLDCHETPQEPEYPVLWCSDMAVTKVGPFGQTVRIDVQ